MDDEITVSNKTIERAWRQICNEELDKAQKASEAHPSMSYSGNQIHVQAAIRLYGACGWRRCGLRPGYYPDGEDALLFRYGNS